MDASKKYYNQQYDTDGNTARKLHVVPKYPNDEEYIQPVRKVKRRPRTKQGIDMFALFIMSVAIIATLYTCVDYLRAQSGSTQMNSKITSMERELTKLQNKNNDTASEIKSNLDLNYIYKVATKDLGMVFPDKNQVITYKGTLSDYVRQFKDIPKDDSKNIINEFIN